MHHQSRLLKMHSAAAVCVAAIFCATALLAAGRIPSKRSANITVATQAAGPSGYHLLKSIPVGGDTFWDYLKFDSSTRRLFISHGTHVVVLDVDSGKVVGDMTGMQGVHGIVLAPEFNRGFVTDGRAAKLVIFDLKTLQVTGSAPTDKDADGVVYDPDSKRVFTMNGDSKTSTVVDAKSGKVVRTIDLGGQPEFPVTDGGGHVYANLESTSEVIEIDAHTLKILRRWPLAPGESPSGLAMDIQNRVLFSGCHNKMMVMMNADTGKVIATAPIGQGVDATRFDSGTGYAFSSNGDGTLTVIHEDSPTQFRVVENVTTERGARTMALDPKTHEVFLATAQFEPLPANAAPRTRRKMVPGTFHILVFGK